MPNTPPSMSSDQILEGRILTDTVGFDHGKFVSFRILEKLGEGGMGLIYRAQQEYPKRIVALKVMKASAALPRNLKRFDREISILASLQHPAIAQLYSVGEVSAGPSGNLPFLAMELVEGTPITMSAKSRSLNIEQKVELMLHVCDGVSHAHSNGIVHRDLKPSNILVSHSGHPKIVDFGLAMIMDKRQLDETTLTEDGQLLGTLDYMSPEQASGRNGGVDHRTDVYALGMILFELLAGRRPFIRSDSTLLEALHQVQESEAPSLSSFNRQFRGDLEVITSKALSKDRNQRYASVDALADDLRRYLANEPIKARRPTASYRLNRFLRRNRWFVASFSTIILALSIGLVMTARESRRANLEALKARDEATRAAGEARNANIQTAKKSLAEGDALVVAGRFDAARKAYNDAWDLLELLKLPTLSAELGVWQIDKRVGRPIRVLAEDAGSIQCATISRDELRFALGYTNGKVQVRTMVSDQVEFEASLPSNVSELRFSPNGKRLYIGNRTHCEIWDIPSKTRLASREISEVNSVAMGDSMVALGDASGLLYVAAIPQLSVVVPIKMPEGSILALEFLDDETVYVGTNHSQILRVSKGLVEVVGSVSTPEAQRALFSPDGKSVAMIGDALSIYELPSCHLISTIEAHRYPAGIAFINGRTLWLPSQDGKTIDYLQANGTVACRIPLHELNPSVTCSDHFAILPDDQGRLILRASQMAGAAHPLLTSDHPLAAALSSDGRIAAVALANGNVRLLDTFAVHMLGELITGCPARSLLFDSQTKRLVIVGKDGRIQLWDLIRMTKEREMNLKGPVRAVALGPSGSICCYSLQGKQGAMILDLDSHSHDPTNLDTPLLVTNILFLESGNSCVLGGPSGAEIWNLDALPEKTASLDASNGISRLGFLRGSDTVVTSGNSQSLRLWNANSGSQSPSPLKLSSGGFSNWSTMGDLVLLRSDDSFQILDPLKNQIECQVQWPKEFSQPIAQSADGRLMLAPYEDGIEVDDWNLPGKLRSFERLKTLESQVRWFAAADLPLAAGNYQPPVVDHPQTLDDAYGRWEANDLRNAEKSFAGAEGLTSGARSLILRALKSLSHP